MLNWLHRLFNPHCEHCVDERRENARCSSCEILVRQVESLQRERDKLLERLLYPVSTMPVLEPEESPPVQSNVMPWETRRLQLELADRERARANQISRDRNEEIKRTMGKSSTEDLEKGLGIANG